MAGDYQTEESEWCSRRRGRKRGAKSGGGVSLKFQNVIRTDCIKNILLHRCYCSSSSSANIIINSRARCRFIVPKKRRGTQSQQQLLLRILRGRQDGCSMSFSHCKRPMNDATGREKEVQRLANQ